MLSFYLAIIETEEGKNKFQELYDKYHLTLYKLSLRITKDHFLAEDALQDAFYSIAINIDKISTDDELLVKGYLYKVVKNASINVLSKRTKEAFLSYDLLTELDSGVDLESELISNQRYFRLVKKILVMPDIYREVATFNLLYNMSCSDIAKVLEININTVKSRLLKAKEILKSSIEEYNK